MFIPEFISIQNYYEISGVLTTASDEEIKKASKTKALSSHPDKAIRNNLTLEKATDIFKQVNEAYETLSAPNKRKLYDMQRSYKKPFDISTPFYSSFYSENIFSKMGFYG